MNDRLKLISYVLSSAALLQKSLYKYMNTPRTYGSDDTLYMREVHFIDELGKANTLLNAEELAVRLDITHGAVTQLTERLEKKGYVYRDKNPMDNRKISRGLTEKGENLYHLHQVFDEKAFSRISSKCEDFSSGELEIFIRISQRLSCCFTDTSSKISDSEGQDIS